MCTLGYLFKSRFEIALALALCILQQLTVTSPNAGSWQRQPSSISLEPCKLAPKGCAVGYLTENMLDCCSFPLVTIAPPAFRTQGGELYLKDYMRMCAPGFLNWTTPNADVVITNSWKSFQVLPVCARYCEQQLLLGLW